MKIAITGATGQLGRLAISALKTRVPATDIVALVRNPDNARELGVETRRADYKDWASLDAALQGIDVLALISSSDFDDRVGQHRNVIDAARNAGVSRIIYTSILKADTSPLLIAGDHKATEPLLTGSGLAYTILRNPWYTENWTAGLGAAIANGALVGCAGDARVSPATRQDLAEAIAAVATEAGHENRVYELGCDAPFTMADLAAELSAQIGKPIPYTDLPKDTYIGILAGIGLPPGFPEVIADADAGAAEGWLLDESKALSELIGRPTTSLSAAVKDALL
ncbi:SDR family oxidoreductase [Aliiruegeria lutimaris]|uniref:NAD(P)H dehydrogenase (Quinone) n=1 Tax=Aliiruegeria lutimaris TaxID=571298 RepID=A0A1G8VJE3_9RHOB|nr:SDR family oxidoreductase [Aliiruegeria lutimaris]SDJ66201.1 NAD(P)H dehydrogenase (quinone) [Aliiruegeria lutimaris]